MFKLTKNELILFKEYVRFLKKEKKEINVDAYILCKLSALKYDSARRTLRSLNNKQVLRSGKICYCWQSVYKNINYRKALYTLRNSK